jgi:hypothetical protein
MGLSMAGKPSMNKKEAKSEAKEPRDHTLVIVDERETGVERRCPLHHLSRTGFQVSNSHCPK